LHVGETKLFQIQGCLATNVCQIAIKLKSIAAKICQDRLFIEINLLKTFEFIILIYLLR